MQRRARKVIVSKLFIDITTSEWSVKGKFQKALSFSMRYIHSWDRKRVLKFLFPLLPLHWNLYVLLFVIEVNENVSSLPLFFFFCNSHVYIFLLPFLLLSCFLQLYVSMLLSRQEQEDFSLFQNIQTSTGAHWSSCLMGILGFSAPVKRRGYVTNH